MKKLYYKSYKWYEKYPNLNSTDRMLLTILIDAWEYHKHHEFTYALKEMSKKVGCSTSDDRAVMRARQTLKDMGILNWEVRYDGALKKCYYTFDDDVLDKLSEGPYTSTAPVVAEEPKVTPETFNDKLVMILDKCKDQLLSNHDFGNTRSSIRQALETPDNVALFGNLNEFNRNYSKIFNEWYQKQKDLKSQAI